MFSQGSRRERTRLSLAFEGLWAYLAAAVAAAGVGRGPKAHTAGGPLRRVAALPGHGCLGACTGRTTDGKWSASRRVCRVIRAPERRTELNLGLRRPYPAGAAMC